mmetsp:Transcript_48366/g.85150  ORF Transcript_48366/g.85150 Transcript_48366/m.85150 type:complete len:311 (-) Transcript_48366:99-1031(-)
MTAQTSTLTGAAAREARKSRQETTGAAARQARKERLEAQKEAERRSKEEAEAARQERVAQAAAARRQAQAEAAAAAPAPAPAPAEAASSATAKSAEEKAEDEEDGEVCLDPVEEESRRKRLADKIAARRLEKEKAEEEKRKAEEEKLKAEEEKNPASSSSGESGEEEKAKKKKRKSKKKKKDKEKKRRKVDSSPSSDAFEMAKKMAEQAAGSFAWERVPQALDKVITHEEPGKAAAPPPDHKVDPGIDKMIEEFNLDIHAAGRLRQLPMPHQKAALRFTPDLKKTGNPSMVCMSLLQELLEGKKEKPHWK